MAEYDPNHQHRQEEAVKSTDRGLFDFMKKKEDPAADHPKPQEEVVVGQFDQKVYEPMEKKERFHGSNSSGGEEEVGAAHPPTGQEKQGLFEKVKDKLPGQHNKPEEEVAAAHRPQEKKQGLVEKIKDKLPGQHNKPEEGVAAAHRPPPTSYEGQEKKQGLVEKIKDKLPGQEKKPEEEVVPHAEYEEAEKKKGFLKKIKDKIPGFHSKGEEEENNLNKDKERD